MANYTILLIDYEPRSIDRFRQPLTDAGYAVEVATDGLTGIEAFHRLNPDMVLVEAMIPKKHGFEVCQELKRTPHGRRTPVLITTGVYKGRKYRTQALHIYGCDEYIEKPIAPEQLLAVVGKFFGPASNMRPSTVPDAESAAPAEAAVATVGDGSARAVAPTSGAREKSIARPTPPKTSAGSVAKDFTEEEIMARLDAILPGGEFAQSGESGAAPIVAAAPEPVDGLSMFADAPADEAHDPFSQMQAELTAELGSMSAALALEPAPVFQPVHQPIPSDQAVSPSVLEALPGPDLDTPQVPAVPQESPVEVRHVAETPAIDPPGQLVNFDVKRSRRKKSGKKSSASASVSAARQSPTGDAVIVSPELDEPRGVRAKIEAEALSLPAGTLAETDLAGPEGKKGVPIWIWATVAAVTLVAVYFVVFHGRTSPSATTSADPSMTTSETTDAVAAVEPNREIPADSKNSSLVLNSIDPPARNTPPPSPANSSSDAAANKLSPVERSQPSKPAAVTAAASTPPESRPRATERTARSAVSDSSIPGRLEADKSKIEAPETAPPSSADEGLGVETIAGVAEQRVVPSIAPGTLVSADELDSAPVSLSRKLPVYSLQARAMRVEGTVVMKVLVNERGTVDEVVLVSGVAGADLNDAAMRAAKSWTYRPGTKGDVPVKVWKIEQVVFKM